MNRSFFGAIVVGLALPAFAEAPVAHWQLAEEYPVSSLPGEGDVYFATTVAEKAAGKLTIEPLHDAKSGFKSREQLGAVAEGKVAMADTFAGALGDENAFFLLSSLPFLATSTADAHRLYELAKPHYEALFKARNQKLLYSTPWPPSGIWAKVPVQTPAAVAKLKIRTYDRTGTELMTALGATASVVSFADLPPALHASVIDAVLSSGDGGAARRLWEALPYFTEINYAMPLSLATVNLDAWNALDAATRKAVLEAAAETEARQWKAMEGRVAKNYERMRENGMTITTKISPELQARFQEAAQAAIARWEEKSGPEGRALIERYRKGATK